MKTDRTAADADALQFEVAGELNRVFENILPWTLATSDHGEMLRQHTDDPEAISQFLDSLYLFKVAEVSVADDSVEESIARALGKRHQALVTAAYQSDLTLATVVVGQGSGVVSLFFGVAGKDQAKEIFIHQLRGIYPGKGIEFHQETDGRILRKALGGKTHGGVVTGIPPVRLDDERQWFDLTNVVRSMHGQPFLLLTVARPVPKEKAARQILEIMKIKDTCHSLVNRTLTQNQNYEVHQEKGSSETDSEGSGTTSTVTKGGGSPTVFGSKAGTGGMNLSGSVSVMYGGGAGIPGVGWGMGSVTYTGTIGGTLGGTLTMGGSVALGSKSQSEGISAFKSKAVGKSESEGWSKSIGQSLQIEQQNSLAMELEVIADKLIKRLRTGLNSGIWETYLTYVTGSDISSRILSGALCGELLKADPDALPSRNIAHALPCAESMFIPRKIALGELLTGNPLVSHVSSEEAAMLLSPPLHCLPGFDIRVKPGLSLTDFGAAEGAKPLGEISEHGRQIEGSSFAISHSDICKHVFVAGLTGSGKTTTVKQLLANADVPFLVLESAKREYRRMLADERFKRALRVYTVGDSGLAPFRHNPFVVLPNVSALAHIDSLKAIFNASFSLYGPMPYLLEQCLHNVYRKKGWNLTTGSHHRVQIQSVGDCRDHCYIYPTIRDLITEVNMAVSAAGYAGELRDNIRSAIVARMESLAVGAKGFILNNNECVDIEQLLEQPAVFELESLADDDDKAFFVGLILSLISEYRQSLARQSSASPNTDLRHILVIEEAHRLLKHISTERTSEMLGNPKGKAVETFCNIIAEMRSFGQGVVVAEQIPTKIAPDVMKNTNTKIIHRLVSSDDQKAIGASLGLPENDCHYLNQLSTGFALVHKEGMARPVEVSIHNTFSNQPVGDDLVRERSRDFSDAEKEASLSAFGDIEAHLVLHESGLLDSLLTRTVARKLLNTIFLSGKELPQALPAAIKEVRDSTSGDYLEDSTIDRALESWFSRILLSGAMDMGDGHMATQKVLEGVHRFWHEPREYGRSRLIRDLDKWRGESSVERVRGMASISVACEIAASAGRRELPEILAGELLLDDPAAADKIRQCLSSLPQFRRIL